MPWDDVPTLLVRWRDGFVGIDAVSNVGIVVASSPDLINWTVLAKGAAAPFTHGLSGPFKLLVTNGGLAAINPTGVWISADGSGWKAVDEVPFGPDLVDVAAGAGGIVAICSEGFEANAMWYSADGESWTEIDLPVSVFKDAGLVSVTGFWGGFVATGGVGGKPLPDGAIGDINSTPAAWWSSDGRVWSRAAVDNPNEAWLFGWVTPLPHALLGFGVHSGKWVSFDGRTWAKLPAQAPVGDYVWGDDTRAVSMIPGAPDVGPATDRWFNTVDGRTWQPVLMDAYPAPWEWKAVFVTPDGLIGLMHADAGSRPTVATAKGVV